MEYIAQDSLKKLFCNKDIYRIKILEIHERTPNLHQLLINLRDQIQIANRENKVTFEILENLMTDEEVRILMCTDKLKQLICDKYHALYSDFDR